MAQVHLPVGTKDVQPQDSYKWHYVENLIRRITSLYGYREIRTPVFEHTELFLRGVGDTTDVVQKEMYTFLDKGDRSITLKPEGTAGAVRSYIENGLSNIPQPVKMFYLTPVFRYERPQAGRLREHHQFGVEVFGAASAALDAEIISLALTVFKTLGVENLRLNINSIGCSQCRPAFNEALVAYISDNAEHMCPTCQDRIKRNPLRVLDCKSEQCKKIVADAPRIIDHLCPECEAHFKELQDTLTLLGIEFKVNPLIVRGLDYYTKTVFEIISDHIGSQGTVCGGGRYDKLVGTLGGPETPGAGFGMGLERLLMVMESQGIEIPQPALTDVYIAAIGERALAQSRVITYQLRAEGVKADCDYMNRTLKAQMKYANKANASYVVIIGDDELDKGIYKLKNMRTGEEDEVSFDRLVQKVKE